MAQPYIGEIRIFAGNFAPLGWAFCDGQLMSISENEALFNLIGTTYGGDGQETFAVPNLQGRLPLHMASNYVIGQMGGTESVTLTTQQIPNHTHPMLMQNAPANSPNPGNNFIGKSTQADIFFADIPATPMNGNSIQPVGGSQPHENMMPFLCVNFIISLFGIYPSPT